MSISVNMAFRTLIVRMKNKLISESEILFEYLSEFTNLRGSANRSEECYKILKNCK